MRILFYSNLHPTPWHPGRGVFNANLVSGLREAGHVVRVVVPVDWREQQGSPQAEVADALFLPWFHPPMLRRDLWDRWMWHSVRGELLSEAREFAPDVIVAGWAHPDGAVGVRLGKRLGIPVAILAGGSDLLVLPRNPRRGRAIAAALTAADLVLTHGRHLREAAVGLGASPERTVAFYRGVDRDLFAPGSRVEARLQLGLVPDARYLLSVGNMVAVKGLDVLVSALSRPELSGLEWTWVHLGDGDQRTALSRAVESAGLGGRVRFPGRQPHARLVDWFRAADLQLLPSRSEGVPNVLLEGLACGLPFVASAVGGVPEIAPDQAWCVPPDDPAAMARAIAAALADPRSVAADVPGRREGIATVTGALERTIAGVA
jgi:glycosyltransferase involved in cell wall biosynthesis